MFGWSSAAQLSTLRVQRAQPPQSERTAGEANLVLWKTTA